MGQRNPAQENSSRIIKKDHTKNHDQNTRDNRGQLFQQRF
jgi:hypothetical protein